MDFYHSSIAVKVFFLSILVFCTFKTEIEKNE